jgi:hypothetical protein
LSNENAIGIALDPRRRKYEDERMTALEGAQRLCGTAHNPRRTLVDWEGIAAPGTTTRYNRPEAAIPYEEDAVGIGAAIVLRDTADIGQLRP